MAILRKEAAPAAFTVPALSQLSPEYARLESRDRELRQRLAAVISELDDLRISRAFNPSASRATSLVDDVVPGAPLPNSADRRNDLEQERRDIVAALELLNGRMSTERYAASRKAWLDLAPVHTGLVKSVVIALARALKAHTDLHKFRGAVNDANLSWGETRQLVATQILGDALDDQSAVRMFLKDAITDGFVTAKEVADAQT